MRSLLPMIAALTLIVWSGEGVAQELTIESNIDYFGGDYTSFETKSRNAEECRKACAADGPRCQSYAYVRPTNDAPNARCYLKSVVGKRTASACCISGRRQGPPAATAPAAQAVRPALPLATAPAAEAARPLLPQLLTNQPPSAALPAPGAGRVVPAPSLIGPVKLPLAFARPGAEAVFGGRVVKIPLTNRPPPTQRRCGANPRDCDGDGAEAANFGGTDCDDFDPRRFPGNTEIPDPQNVDEDCDLSTFGTVDEDRDGYFDAANCNVSDGYIYCGTDCDDRNPRANPGHMEVCDGIDNDCNGLVDDGVMMTVFRDNDRDGFGDSQAENFACFVSPGWAANNYDCDDNNPQANPITGACR